MRFNDPFDLLRPLLGLRGLDSIFKDGHRIGPGRPSLRKNWPGTRTLEKGWRKGTQENARRRRQMEKEISE